MNENTHNTVVIDFWKSYGTTILLARREKCTAGTDKVNNRLLIKYS